MRKFSLLESWQMAIEGIAPAVGTHDLLSLRYRRLSLKSLHLPYCYLKRSLALRGKMVDYVG